MRRRFITKKENEIKQIINFIDRDVDGDGINIETLIQVEGEPLTAGVVQRTKDAIEKYKENIKATGLLMMLLKKLVCIWKRKGICAAMPFLYYSE